MKNRKLLLAGSALLLCFSCYYDELVPEEVPIIPTDTPISFADDIEPLFARSGKNCTACHNGTVANPDLRAGNAFASLVPQYVKAGNAAGSEFYQKLPGNGHPFDVGFTLSTDDIALIKAWIDRGAENN